MNVVDKPLSTLGYLKEVDNQNSQPNNPPQPETASPQETVADKAKSALGAAGEHLPKIQGNMLENSRKVLVVGGILAILLAAVVVLAPVVGNLFSRSSQESEVITAPPASEAGYVLLATSSAIPVDTEFKVSIVVKSEADEANLFVARLKFPSEFLEVSSIDLKPTKGGGFISDWFIASWVENFFDNTEGTVSLVGGVPDPGFKTSLGGEGALMAQILFKAKKTGSATISFEESSAIYRNIDNANILATKQELALTIAGITPTPVLTVPGDINTDGVVDLTDLSALLSRFGQNAQGERADLNSDNNINSIDFSLLVKILLEKQVIEPASSPAPATESGSEGK